MMKSASDRPAPHTHESGTKICSITRKGSVTQHYSRNFIDSRRYQHFIPATGANLKTTRDLEERLCYIVNYFIYVWIYML